MNNPPRQKAYEQFDDARRRWASRRQRRYVPKSQNSTENQRFTESSESSPRGQNESPRPASIRNESSISKEIKDVISDSPSSPVEVSVPSPGVSTSRTSSPLHSAPLDVSKLSAPTEIKHALRKIEFPGCSKYAMVKIEQLLVNKAGSIKYLDLTMDLMAEFIFCEVDRRGNRKPAALTSLQELQLLQVLCEYFSGSATEQVKNTVFLSLFPPGTSLTLRIKILSKLVSIAVCIPSPAVLHAAGIWMQQLGNTSTHSIQLAKALVNDYFVFTPSAVSRLRSLPTIAPHFTANFLTAVAEIYLTEKRNTFSPPPTVLLETVKQWIVDNPKLCTAPQNILSSLPPGAIQMAAITPFAGLLKWCILQPMHNAIRKYDSALHLIKNTKMQIPDNEELYRDLFWALLKSISLLGPGNGPPNVICAQHLVSVIPILQIQIGELLRLGRNIKIEASLEVAMGRLSEIVQVSLSCKCIYGNIQELINQLDQLPDTYVLKYVVSAHKEIVL